MLIDLSDALTENSLLESNVYLWKAPKVFSSHVNACPVQVLLIEKTAHSVSLQVTGNDLRLYVLISSAAAGTFTKNSFHLRPSMPKTIEFSFTKIDEGFDVDSFLNTLWIEDLLNDNISISLVQSVPAKGSRLYGR
jgi:Ig-fold domain